MGNDTTLYDKFGRTVNPGEIVFSEGEMGDQMFIIQSGKVRISKKIGEREHILAVMGKGDFFGEMAIVNNVKRTATVTAVTRVDLLYFNRKSFASMINKNPRIALNIIDKLCRRLQNMNLQIQHLVKKNSRGLVALNLLYAFKQGDINEISIFYDRTVEEISLNLELPLDIVKSFIEGFAIEKIIAINANKIVLSDREKLNRITEGISN